MTRLTCRDVIDLLADYLEATVSPETLAAFERHLEGCPACVAYLNTYRKTRELTATVARVSMPQDMQARLRAFLIEQLRGG
ncbi:MAG TPA: anti-sigma factor [Methylomirabilota bacterium]|jgi:anti-sigma factor (TIGR02949 family)|nr:anti-sigma factor [Methylomirabilota bacterium]